MHEQRKIFINSVSRLPSKPVPLVKSDARVSQDGRNSRCTVEVHGEKLLVRRLQKLPKRETVVQLFERRYPMENETVDCLREKCNKNDDEREQLLG